MNKKLTRDEAIELHRKMWQDMQTELGDNPSYHERVSFKKKWVKEHFPNEYVNSNCFLCEYAQSVVADSFTRCRACPIEWNFKLLPTCQPYDLAFYGNKVDYRYSPISVILALPEREVVE